MAHDLRQTAIRAIRALADLRQMALAECGVHPEHELADSTSFRLLWHPSMTERELVDQAMHIASECASVHEVFRSGSVYCYACGNAGCAHSQQAGPGMVFSGYGSTGRPRWEELFNFLLHIGDSRTDQLFVGKPQTLARVVGRRRLTDEQLTSFGKNSLTYRIWGQLVAGYFRLDTMRAALTAQIVETRDHGLHFQVITDDLVRDALANAPQSERSPLHRIHDALAEARRQVFSLSQLWQQQAARPGLHRETQEKVFGILRHLAHSIERKGRQHYQRTAHAELRGQQSRPVHKAREDLLAGSTDDFFRDTVKESLIVLGKGGRMHVFSPDGKHITSLMIDRDELERRQRRQRFVPLEAEASNKLKRAAMIPADENARTEPEPA